MNAFKGRHFTGIIILWAVRWYCKYGISYRELQEMLAAHATIKGIEVMRALRKGQAEHFYYGQPLGEVRLVNRVFGL